MPTVRKAVRPWMKPAGSKPKQNNQGGDNANRAVYDTRRHRTLRRLHLQENPLCVKCKAEGRLTPATIFDHIKAINDGGDPWADDNKQGLCFTCHQSKRALERKARRS